MQEVPLVDGLDPERVPRFAEQREDRSSLLLFALTQRRVPQGALLPRVGGDRLPEVSVGSPTGHVSGSWAAAKFHRAVSSAVRV